jgi:adenine/guanine/hypoxanthine permease
MSTDVTEPPAEPPSGPATEAAAAEPPAAEAIAWWTRGDTNAFFGLGFNILVNVLTLSGLMIGVVKVPAGDVLGTVLPALGVALILGNLYYTFLARRLARRENRTDVTALPYGPSVPHMFIVVFVVMLPIYLKTKDPMQAWESGLAWAFMIGVIGAFLGPYIRKLTPLAAMLGTLAGISITFISMRPAAQMWEAAWIGLAVLATMLIGFFTDVRLPFNIPVGLAALRVRSPNRPCTTSVSRWPVANSSSTPSATRTLCGSRPSVTMRRPARLCRTARSTRPSSSFRPAR